LAKSRVGLTKEEVEIRVFTEGCGFLGLNFLEDRIGSICKEIKDV
jgi:hypothetical protein